MERVVRELDPADVLLLYQLSTAHIEPVENDQFDREGMRRMDLLERHPRSRDILRAAGCVDWKSNGGFDGGVFYADITTIAEAVLEVLGGYVRASAGTQEAPVSVDYDAPHDPREDDDIAANDEHGGESPRSD